MQQIFFMDFGNLTLPTIVLVKTKLRYSWSIWSWL